MRSAVAALTTALSLLVPALGVAQTVLSFQDLPLRINLDDSIRVEDQSGARTTGRLTRLTGEDIAVRTDAGEKRLTADAVRGVAVRGHALAKGALIGAAVFAVLGAVATCTNEGGSGCFIIGTFGGAPIGAGLGLTVAALVPRMKTIYRAPEHRASERSPRGVGVQPSLLEDLGLRVNLDDQIRVHDQSGVQSTGRLTRLTPDEITVKVGDAETRFTRETARQIAVRRRPLRAALLIGAGAGAVAGAIAACTGPDREECVDAPIMAGALGAGLGLAVGALIHKTTVVYPEADRRALAFLPAISRHSVGVQARLDW